MTLQEYADWLDSLRDADGVAFACAMFDVRGPRWGMTQCPVARVGTMLTGETIHVTGSAMRQHTRPGYVRIPYHARQFITRFDRGGWSELEGKWSDPDEIRSPPWAER